ncbi:MAG: hypothetical protein NC432_06630 [Roseburia sp.]|nr:hypothetical protein [Roseburia sp.]MCM1097735.1 hypothetical protein [Ruminococcus flavefaciens]
MSKTAVKAEETAAATAETRAASATKEAKAGEAVAYLGPDLKNVAINGTVYTGGLPEALKEKLKEVPALKGLLVPVSNLAAAGVAVATQGTAINNLYNAVSAKIGAKQE